MLPREAGEHSSAPVREALIPQVFAPPRGGGVFIGNRQDILAEKSLNFCCKGFLCIQDTWDLRVDSGPGFMIYISPLSNRTELTDLRIGG